MKTITISGLWNTPFALEFLAATKQNPPAWKHLQKKNRHLNGYVYIREGFITYSFSGGSFKAGPGSLIFLPEESSYRADIADGPFCLYQLMFRVIDTDTFEHIRFSELPLLVSSRADDLLSLFSSAAKAMTGPDQQFVGLSLLSQVISAAAGFEKLTLASGIEPAINYLNVHFREPLSIAALADIAHVSEPTLYRLFRRETGLSPMEYRDSLRLNEAKRLLRIVGCSVSAAASMTGFDSIYYFSRFFRKKTGCSPSEYGRG